MFSTYRLVVGVLTLVCVGACGSNEQTSNDRPATVESRAAQGDGSSPERRPADDTARLDSVEQARVDSIVAAIRACPRDGRWHPCSLERRLSMSGLRPVRADSTPRLPGISEPATLWQMGGQSLRVVFFADSAAAIAAMATLDPARGAPRGDTAVVWTQRVTMFRAANVVALYLGGSDRQVERVSDAVLAGPPQPD